MNFLRHVWSYLGFLTTAIAFYLAYLSIKLWWVDSEYFEFSVVIAACCFYIIPTFIIIFKFSNFRRYVNSINKALILYFEMIFIFSGLYCWIFLIGNDTEFTGFSCFGREMLSSRDNFDMDEYVKQLLNVIVDSLYFSLVTATTVGYGDISPNGPFSKTVVILQILINFTVVVFGVNGRHNHS